MPRPRTVPATPRLGITRPSACPAAAWRRTPGFDRSGRRVRGSVRVGHDAPVENHTTRPRHVAVVGSGPSGFYAAAALLDAEPRRPGGHVRPARHPVGPRPRGRRPGPPEDQVGELAVRQDRRAATGSGSSGTCTWGTTRSSGRGRGRRGHHPRRAARALRRDRLRGGLADRAPPRHPGRGPARQHRLGRLRRLVQRPPRPRRPRPAARLRAGGGDRRRQRRPGRGADAAAARGRPARHRHRRPRPRRLPRLGRCARR